MASRPGTEMENHHAPDVVRAFVDAVNARNLEAVFRLITDDHHFIDSLGQVVKGREAVRQAWESYFRIVPDYTINVHQVLESGDVVAVFGVAEGTYAVDGQLLEAYRWHTPAAWRAIVRDGKVWKWQVYADNEPIRALMREVRDRD